VGLPAPQKRMLVHVPRDDFVRIWDGLRSARGPVGGPSNATPLRVAFAEMPAVAVHHSLERFHNARLAGIECRIRIQPLDDFHDLSIAGPDLQDVAAHRDEIRRIWTLVEALPVQQRTPLLLQFEEDLKNGDIPVDLGQSPGAVTLLIHPDVTRLRAEAGPLRPVDSTCSPTSRTACTRP